MARGGSCAPAWTTDRGPESGLTGPKAEVTPPFHTKFWAHSPSLARYHGADAISRSIGNPRMDLNLHEGKK
jgi:hypothetical protein